MAGDMVLPKDVWKKESKELHNAIYDDWKRKAIDNAKKRAVAQNVDYPTFANLVSVAHLKPIERKLLGQGGEECLKYIYKGTIPAWSFDPSGTNKSLDLEYRNEDGFLTSLDSQKLGINNRTTLAKITNDMFAKHWRNFNKDVFLQMAYLTSFDPLDFCEIFKVELPPNLLVDILTTICTCFRAKKRVQEDLQQQRLLPVACTRDVDENWTIRMLEAMTQCGRFSLAFGFVGEKTRAMITALVTDILHSNLCKTFDDAKEANIQSSCLSRLQNIITLYQLKIDRKNI